MDIARDCLCAGREEIADREVGDDALLNRREKESDTNKAGDERTNARTNGLVGTPTPKSVEKVNMSVYIIIHVQN